MQPSTRKRGETKKWKTQRREPRPQQNQHYHQQHHRQHQQTMMRKHDGRKNGKDTNISTAKRTNNNINNPDNICEETSTQPSSTLPTSSTSRPSAASVGTDSSTHSPSPHLLKSYKNNNKTGSKFLQSSLLWTSKRERSREPKILYCTIDESVCKNMQHYGALMTKNLPLGQ